MGVKNHQQKHIQVSRWWKIHSKSTSQKNDKMERNRPKKSPTPPKTNMTSENIHVQQEIHLQWWIFPLSMLVFGGVMLEARHPELPKPIQFLGSSPLVFWDYCTPLWKLRWLAEKSRVFPWDTPTQVVGIFPLSFVSFWDFDFGGRVFFF